MGKEEMSKWFVEKRLSRLSLFIVGLAGIWCSHKLGFGNALIILFGSFLFAWFIDTFLFRKKP